VVIRIITETVSGSQVNLDGSEQLVETILIRLRPVVQSSVETALSTSSSGLSANNLSDRILVQLRPFVQEGVRKEIVQGPILRNLISAENVFGKIFALEFCTSFRT
jgi:hypothetical protein